MKTFSYTYLHLLNLSQSSPFADTDSSSMKQDSVIIKKQQNQIGPNLISTKIAAELKTRTDDNHIR